MDCRYGIPRLSKKSCSRVNKAAQRTSQSAFASPCLVASQSAPAQPPRCRKSKRQKCMQGTAAPYLNRYHNRTYMSCSVPEGGIYVLHVLGAAMDRQLPTEPFRLAVPFSCHKCGAKKFMFESLHFCCGNGDITIAATEYPPELAYLFTSKDEGAVHFRKYARLYNNLFAFSLLGGHYYANTHKGIYLFKLHGQMYHFVPDLLPDNDNPKYLQLYFYDGQHELENRVGCFPEIREDVISILMQVSMHNPYAVFFRTLRDRVIHADTRIVLNQAPVLDQRVYYAPAIDEVAAIWPESASSSQSLGPHILVSGRSDKSHRIYHNYGCYDPLQYPLIFPQLSAKKKNTRADKFISAREYYAYRLQIRPNNMLLRVGRCFQQYIVDMYVKIENTRLDYFRNNQDTIRADLYKGILDSLDSGETLGENVGRRVILPPTYIGGPRDMKKRYLNAMALVQRFGKPDLFVTITCNANWPEIKAELAAGEAAQDRPDLVARIFRAKLVALRREIMENKIFREVAAMCPTDYDRFVCAEIPAPTNGVLRRIVLAHMMHGPCGILNPDCPCMKKTGVQRSCKNKYPKQFCNETTNNKDGYPIYRRRVTGEQVTIRNAQLDNQWVIPYNPYLSMLFDCHLNVEVCSTIKAVKYLYKYVYKGHDRISYNVVGSYSEPVDEIHQYQSGRWVSPCKAAWRIFSFDLFEMHPSVFSLQVHLPYMQTVHVRPHEKLRSVVLDDKRSRTQLTDFFAMNTDTEHGLGYLYGEFCEHYTWHQGDKR
ncbi:uncharacterized protein LOC110690169 [Chenopodium quinoa]|uniref:uncharacterized protein LOC110690169 n=1 Tax=Chenopodium quinoa TaxID=63459 RepID=UPI000B773A98|nr:uncharacterized protein LOC110690169 [Chenopodium quinoa]